MTPLYSRHWPLETKLEWLASLSAPNKDRIISFIVGKNDWVQIAYAVWPYGARRPDVNSPTRARTCVPGARQYAKHRSTCWRATWRHRSWR